MAESPGELQHALDVMYEYCENWALSVNVDKTKILIFSRGKIRNKPIFIFNDDEVEVVDSFKYLGVLFNYNNKPQKCKKFLYDQAYKAMFAVIQKSKKLYLPVDLMIELFDKLVTPILTYGAEVWGFGDNVLLERLYLKFMKMVLHVKRSTPSCMVYGETGTFPIQLSILQKMLGFWSKLCNSERPHKISVTLYRLLKELDLRGVYSSPWILKVKNVLDSLGMSDLWINDNFNVEWFKVAVKLRLKDQYLQSWTAETEGLSYCTIYRLFKNQFGVEKYLCNLSVNDRITLTKFRTSNIAIPINSMRFNNIARKDRKCELCNANEIGDEFHYLMKCEYFTTERKVFLKRYYFTRPNSQKFASLLNCEKPAVLKNLV